MFKSAVINSKINIYPQELKDRDINDILSDTIKSKIGNKCIQNGYVKKDTIEIIRRTIGKIETQFLNGMIVYNLQLKVDLCNPQKGDIIRECKVIGKNKMGIMTKNGPLEIVLASVHHIDNELFKQIQPDHKIDIEVIGIRFELYDDTISVIGKLN